MAKVDAGPLGMSIAFRPNPPVDALRIITLVQNNRHVRLAGNERLRIDKAFAEPKDRAQYIRDILRGLGEPSQAAATA